MSDKYVILMHKDVEVMALDSSDGWTVYEEKFIPKGLWHNPPEWKMPITGDTLSRRSMALDKFTEWCSGRILDINRKYARKILSALNLSIPQNFMEKAKIAIAFRAVSLLDSYWLRFGPDDNKKWSDVNLRENSLNRAIAAIALTGSSMSLIIDSTESTAELSTLGSYAKGWFRDECGQLWLHKAAGEEKNEVEREVCASNIIDKLGVVANCKYELSSMFGVKTSRCKLMSSERISIIHAAEVNSWCVRQGTDVVTWVKGKWEKEYAQMVVVDYLLANSDRHMWNWGFLQNNDTGEIIGMHPLYDHNNCFDEDFLRDEFRKSLTEEGKTMRDAALFYAKRSGIWLTSAIGRKEFPSKLAFEVFEKRCTQLGILGYKRKVNLFVAK